MEKNINSFTFDEFFDRFLERCNIKMYPFEKEFLKKIVLNSNRYYYWHIPSRQCCTDFRIMAYILSELYKTPFEDTYLSLMSGESLNE